MFTIDQKRLIDKLEAVGNAEKYLRDLAVEVENKIINLKKSADRTVADAEERCMQLLRIKGDIERIINANVKGFPWLADMIARYFEQYDELLVRALKSKSRPARTAAESVKKISAEKRVLRKQLLEVRWRLNEYEAIAPWLREYADEDVDVSLLKIVDSFRTADEDEESDPVKIYMPPGEYEKLLPAERNQRALDRYWKRTGKPNWLLGKEYERYVGYLYETQGYLVTYHGVEKGREDLGRDLICKKYDEVHIVQCKRWSQQKLIHENHINQLFGTTVEYYINSGFQENRIKNKPKKRGQLDLITTIIESKNIVPVFYTTTTLSDTARKFALALGVELKEKEAMSEYPCIKCNISRKNSDKIYHLPFDQQYDKVVIEVDKGEFYARTVAEAEKCGFRRAWKYRGGSSN
jgi:hypothetical protein